MSEFRRYYLKIALWFYAAWVVVFIAEGFYTVTLPTQDLTIWIDRKFPVVSGFVWIYFLCYVFPLLPIFISRNWHRFNLALISIALCSLIAFVFHIAIPVSFPRLELGTSFSDRVLCFVYENDFRPNAQNFPSLHVAIAWIIFFTCRHQGLRKLWEWMIFFVTCLIVASTVLIKQHLVADLVGGTVLAFTCWSFLSRYYALSNHESDDARFALLRTVRKSAHIFLSTTFVIIGIMGYQILRNIIRN
jgi:membrane-associated phospholipid phosphatase